MRHPPHVFPLQGSTVRHSVADVPSRVPLSREALSAALSVNTVLQRLDLAKNAELTAAAVCLIAEALVTTSGLTSLDLSAAKLQVR